jgi:hypothetical protein
MKTLHRILVAFLISLFAAFLTSANGQSPPASSSGAHLLQGSDLVYVRSFQIPVQYGAGALGFNPKNNSLFIGGSVAAGQQNKPLAAEVAIPTADTMAKILQPFADPSRTSDTPPRQLDAVCNAQGIRLGGLCPYNDSLLWSAYGYYDATNRNRMALGRSSLNLAEPNAEGMFSLSATVDGRPVPNGAMAGWIVPIPEAWSNLFRGTHFVGLGGVPIISRTSEGCAAFGVNVTQLSTARPTPAIPYIYYPTQTHKMAGFNKTPRVWNGEVRGLACIAGPKVKGMLFVGTQPTGKEWYGLAKIDPKNPRNRNNPRPELSGTDPCSIYEGNHSQGKMPTAWIFDPNVVAAAPRPYAPVPVQVSMGGPDSPNPHLQPVCSTLNGIAHDPAKGLLYLRQDGKMETWVHVYKYPL